MGLTEYDWEDLLYAISDKKCIPFVGPGACNNWINFDGIARRWAQEYNYPYPLDDSSQLSRLTQFVSVQERDEVTTKDRFSRELRRIEPPDFSLPEYQDTPYAVLANLGLPIYLTTNYDHFMESALRSKGKEPISQFCVWRQVDRREQRERGSLSDYPTKQIVSDINSSISDNGSSPYSSARPLVFHLHGDISKPSFMVLTEKDYIDFVIHLSKMGDSDTLPSVLSRTLADSTLLFIGYRLEDINFLVVFQGVIKLISPIERKSIAVQVQMPSNIDLAKKDKVQEYLDKLTDRLFQIRVFWGTTEDFTRQLRERWNQFNRVQAKATYR